jgi:preprotein translocase subunit Sec63
MDEKTEKAFAVANYMATLSNQRRIALEEYNQKLVYYINGATFKIDPNLINFTKTLLDLEYTSDVPFVDANGLPVVINNVQEFFDTILLQYITALNEYAVVYSEIKSKRKISDIVEL